MDLNLSCLITITDQITSLVYLSNQRTALLNELCPEFSTPDCDVEQRAYRELVLALEAREAFLLKEIKEMGSLLKRNQEKTNDN